ncbi:hypothetical protein [Parvibaculum sp.]|uniref:hypothetical protein n=1 Tax=Parvibaculum sp. TaxID=2024848 RepID=UPI001DAECCF4|nr:hypothetical protein [Parvibaculum sp.]MBX3488886.1 hypothetical protein [Parvibaculum sp.]
MKVFDETAPGVFEETAETITLHGLGFLQVKLGGGQRLHVWHPALPRRRCFQHSSIHDHRFSFESRVIVGTAINHLYGAREADAGEPPTHIGYLHEGPRTAFGNRPWLPDLKLVVEKIGAMNVPAGAGYRMLAYRYHATEPGGDGRVATIMRKTGESMAGAHSLCEAGVTPDADFDRKQWLEDRLWAIVRDVLGGAA